MQTGKNLLTPLSKQDRSDSANVHKFQYLRAVQGFAVNNDNHLVALDILELRFTNGQAIISQHYRELTLLQRAGEVAKNLRKFSAAFAQT